MKICLDIKISLKILNIVVKKINKIHKIFYEKKIQINNTILLPNKATISFTNDNSINNELSKFINKKDITNEIIIELYFNNTDIPFNILYENHKYILIIKNPEIRNKNAYRCILWRRLKEKQLQNILFVIQR